MIALTLDAGALIAVERADRTCLLLLAAASQRGLPFLVPAGALAQAWRDGKRQARLARFLRTPKLRVVPLDDELARASGQRCGVTGTADVVDAAVAIVGRRHGGLVMTSDPDDLRRLDPSLELIVL